MVEDVKNFEFHYSEECKSCVGVLAGKGGGGLSEGENWKGWINVGGSHCVVDKEVGRGLGGGVALVTMRGGGGFIRAEDRVAGKGK